MSRQSVIKSLKDSHCIVQMFDGGKHWWISHQKIMVGKTLANSCLLTFFIVQTINSFGYQCAAYIHYSHECELLNQWYVSITVVYLSENTLLMMKSWLSITCLLAYITEEGIFEDNGPFGSSISLSKGQEYIETTSRSIFQITIYVTKHC